MEIDKLYNIITDDLEKAAIKKFHSKVAFGYLLSHLLLPLIFIPLRLSSSVLFLEHSIQ